MEQDNQSNEHLERFLHRAFDQFSANPPDVLWSRIQGNMQPAPPPAKVIALRRWHLAVAASLVLLLFAGQHLYFHTQIQQIHQQLSAEVSNTTLTPDFPATPNHPSGAASSFSITSTKPQEHPPRYADRPQSTQKKSAASEYPVPHSVSSTTTPTFTTTDITTPPVAPDSVKAAVPTITIPPAHIINYFRPSSLPLAVSTAPQITLRAIKLPVQARSARKWAAVGVHVLPGNAYLNVTSNNKVPDNGQPDPHPDRLFADASPAKGSLLIAGITAEKSIHRHWSLTSGLDYAEQQFSKTIKPSLRFGDRRNGPGGHDPHDHNFDYDVATGSGTWSVNVEVRESDTSSSSAPLDDDDPVTFSIQTNEKTQILSIPLSLKFHTSYKHWNVFATAGFRMNTFLKRQENITGFSSESDRLTIKGTPQITRPDKAAQRTLTLDYALSGGVEYRTGPLGFSVSPVFTAPVIKPVKDERITVNNCWAGINMGMQYYF